MPVKKSHRVSTLRYQDSTAHLSHCTSFFRMNAVLCNTRTHLSSQTEEANQQLQSALPGDKHDGCSPKSAKLGALPPESHRLQAVGCRGHHTATRAAQRTRAGKIIWGELGF